MSSQRIRPFHPGEKNYRWVFLCTTSLIFMAVLMQQHPVRAQEPIPTPVFVSDDQVNAIAREMYCPVCENIPLDVCSTQACAEWRELIREKLAEGWSEKQIGEYFVERFGDRVSSMPPLHWINWLVYLVPLLAFISASAILFRAVRNSFLSKVSNLQTDVDAKYPNDPYVERFEEELKNF